LMNTAHPVLLSVKSVSVHFGGLKAVDNVSFDVHQGELLGLIGPNGAGKTTMMRAITGVVGSTSGSIHLTDHDLTRLPIHQRIRKGLAFSQQLVKPFREISILDNVALAAGKRHTHAPFKALLHTSASHERDIARQMLARVGISRHADQLPGIQPLGVLKRLEVARALAQEPK